MLVRDILTDTDAYVTTISPSAPVVDALEMLQFENVGALIASIDDAHILGILCESDLARGLYEFGREFFNLEVRNLMCEHVATCTQLDPLSDVLELMRVHDYSQLPVVRRGRLVGLVRLIDIPVIASEPAVRGWGTSPHPWRYPRTSGKHALVGKD